MRACILATSPHQCEWGEAFASGLRRHGHQAEINRRPTPCDLLVLWGVRRIPEMQAQKAAGGEVCILERGYLGDRFKWTSVSFGGGLNGRAEFRGVSADPTRFARHYGELMQPWRASGDYALLIGQVPGDMSLAAINGDLRPWYQATADKLKAEGYEVRYRPHPLAARRGPVPAPLGVPLSEGTLEDAMAGASLVVTYNSNTGVESVLAGVPTMAADIGSMAWPMTSHAPEDEPVTPDRTAWAARLAWCQWSLDEMRSGECWTHVGEEMLQCA